MNNFKTCSIILTSLMFSISACNNENILKPTDLSEFNYDVKSQIPISDISVKEGLLVFKDMETFQFALSDLERQVEELDNAFIEKYKELDEEAINNKEEELNFNELAPLAVFEKELGFNSLRKKIANQEYIWLQNEELDFDNNPNNHVVLDKFARTLLNENEEVMIGSSIYKLMTDGSYYEITNGDFSLLESLREQKLSKARLGRYVIHHNEISVSENGKVMAPGCKTSKKVSGEKKAGDYKIVWRTKIFAWPWQCGALAEVTSYKHKRKNKWKKYRTNLRAGLRAHFCDSNGDLTIGSNQWYDRFETNKKSCTKKITGACQTKSGAVSGWHVARDIGHQSLLTF